MAVPLAVVAGETLPHDVEAHDTVQFTPLFAGSLVTVAMNCAVACGCTVAVLGETDTVTAGTVIVAVTDLLGSVTEVAVSVTVRVVAGGPGAV